MSAPLTIPLVELDGAVGRSFGPSAWHEITQARIDMFADATDDHQWIHVDPKAAAAGPFGTTIAHGYLTLAVCPSLLHEVFEVTERRLGLNYGLDRVRFPRPVQTGSRVRLSGTVFGVKPVPDGAEIALDLRLDVEGDTDRPACVARAIFRYLR